MLCRSGVRSIAAAQRATELGVEAYNILEGFEGDRDERWATREKRRLAVSRAAVAPRVISGWSQKLIW